MDSWAVVAECRALRASVLRLWHETVRAPDVRDQDDVTRFHEAIDQSITQAVRSYAEVVERDLGALLAREQAAREQAEAANRAKDLFLATLSHEIRTPLNAIVGWLSILRQEDAAAGVFQEGLKAIERNTTAQVQLVDDLLDVSRIVSGKLRVDIQPCDLASVINAGVNVTPTAAEARGIRLNVRLDPSAADALCDSVRIQQVVWNLVSNAVKFTPKGGEVHVTLGREESSFQIRVSDNGVHVLVVDDQPDARRVLAMVLERVGAIVTIAESARAARDAIPTARPDVLVSDLGMPDQDGYDLIRQVREGGHDARNLPPVALTAFIQKDDAYLALLAGFQVHLPKPVDPHELTSVIARLAARHR